MSMRRIPVIVDYICSFLHLTAQRCKYFVYLVSICPERSCLSTFCSYSAFSLTYLVRAHSHLWVICWALSRSEKLKKNLLESLGHCCSSNLIYDVRVEEPPGVCHLKLQIACNKKPNHLIGTAADRYTAHLFPLGTSGWTAIYERRQLFSQI